MGNRYFATVASRSVASIAGLNTGSGIGDVWA
jgi:hypothetical protein